MARQKKGPEVQRCDRPPEEDTRFIPIISAMCNTTLHLVVLNPTLTGLWTHYYLDRTIPCMGRTTGCMCRVVKLAKRWKGYLGVWWPQAARCGLAEVTIEAFRNNPKLFEDGKNLRGIAIGMFRLTANKRGPVRIYTEGKVTAAELEQLPGPIDVMRALYAVWGYRPEDYTHLTPLEKEDRQ